MKVEFCSHLNEFGRLWEFLSKLLKFGNNDIVGSVPLQWTGIVATYLTINHDDNDDINDKVDQDVKIPSGLGLGSPR